MSRIDSAGMDVKSNVAQRLHGQAPGGRHNTTHRIITKAKGAAGRLMTYTCRIRRALQLLSKISPAGSYDTFNAGAPKDLGLAQDVTDQPVCNLAPQGNRQIHEQLLLLPLCRQAIPTGTET